MSQIFSFQSVPVRTRIENESIWFVAKDVCAVLGITWSGATMKTIPEQWRTMLSFNIVGKNRRVACISEPAVYKLAFRSNKPEADAFTNWVASEVLPTIRKTGKYEAKPQPEALPKQKALPAPAPTERIGRCRGTILFTLDERMGVKEFFFRAEEPLGKIFVS